MAVCESSPGTRRRWRGTEGCCWITVGMAAATVPRSWPRTGLGEYVEDVVAVLDGAGAGRAALVVIRPGPGSPMRSHASIPIASAPWPGSARWAHLAMMTATGPDGRRRSTPAVCGRPWAGWPPRSLSRRPGGCWTTWPRPGRKCSRCGWKPGAAEPGAWADFPHVQAPALVICGENEEPHAARNARMAADMLPQGTAVVLPGLWHLQAFWRTDQTLPPLTDSSTSTSAPAKNPRLSGEAALATTPVPQRRRRECSHSRGSSRPAPGVGPQPRDQRHPQTQACVTG